MEPNTNLNPTPNPAPSGVPNPIPGGASNPAPNGAPSEMPNPAPEPVPNPAPSPVPNPMPEPAPEPVSEPALQVSPAPNVAPVAPKPVNPVINPGAGASGVPGVDLKNPVIQPSAQGLAATDPIMMPEPAPAPDPIEEELKAPMKANDPVPGSIGSAVSGPAASEPNPVAMNPFAAGAQDKATNVSFNDPAIQPDAQPSMDTNPKKKANKTTLIALIIVFVLIIGVLAVFLVMQVMSPVANNAANNANTEMAVVEDNEEEEYTDEGGTIDASSTLSCTRDMTEAEVKKNEGAASGTVEVIASFDNKRNLTVLAVKEYVVDSAEKNTIEVKNQELLASEITVENSADYYLTVDPTDKTNLNLDALKTAYELDFVCEVL